MKKSIVILLSVGMLFGCGETVTSESTNNYQMVSGLEGCKVFELDSKTKRNLYVVRCPETTSTTWVEQQGKNHYTRSVTTDNYDSTAGYDSQYEIQKKIDDANRIIQEKQEEIKRMQGG